MNILQGLPLARTVPFSHKGRNYEIRVFSDGHNMVVKAFEGNREANGYSHSVTFPVAVDLKHETGVDAIDVLIDDAKKDIVEERWEKYVLDWMEQIKKNPKSEKKG
jgi:hypothetical protein